MREWFSRVLPTGRWHDPLTEAATLAGNALLVVLVFLLAHWVLLRGLKLVMRPIISRAEREGHGQARLRTLEGLSRSVISYTLLLVAGITLLDQIGINVATLVAGAGVAGLALSFGAQRLVRDVLTGFFLLLEDQFRVGEVVTLICTPGLGQLNGTVQEMGLRVTRMHDLAGKLVTIGNGDIIAVVNHNRGPVTATVDLGLAAEVPLDRVREVLEGADLPPALFTGKPHVEGVTALEAGKRVIRIAAPSAPGRGPEAELTLRQIAGEALTAAGVELR